MWSSSNAYLLSPATRVTIVDTPYAEVLVRKERLQRIQFEAQKENAFRVLLATPFIAWIEWKVKSNILQHGGTSL